MPGHSAQGNCPGNSVIELFENLLALSVMMDITVSDILVYYREEDESPLLHFFL